MSINGMHINLGIICLWIPVFVGIAVIVWGIYLMVRCKKMMYRFIQIMIIFLVIPATLGQILMLTTRCWPTYLFILVIVMCAIIQPFMHFFIKKLL